MLSPTTSTVRALDLVVLADVHLGTASCKAEALCGYLRRIQPEVLVINGDLIDLTRSDTPVLPAAHKAVLHALLRLSVAGTRIYYLTGNEDARLRRHEPFSAGNVHLREELVLQVGGKRYWFSHGDGLERVDPSRGVATGGKRRRWRDWYCRTLLRSNRRLVAANPTVLTDEMQCRFERNAVALARAAGYDGAVCGHAGTPVLRFGAPGRPAYLNPGHWNTHRSSLEVKDGEWSLHRYTPSGADDRPVAPMGVVRLAKLAERPEAQLLTLLGVALHGG